MTIVVVALQDAVPDRMVIDWVIARAGSTQMQIRLFTAIDVSESSPERARQLLADAARRIQQAAADVPVESIVTDRPPLHELLELSRSADLVVIGSHPESAIRDGRTPSLPVSLAARSGCAVVIVPDDWQARPGPIVVGVDTVEAAHEATERAAQEADAIDRELAIVHTWEPWTVPHTRRMQYVHEGVLAGSVDRIRVEFPALRIRAVLSEAVAHRGILANSIDAHLIVLGTHGLGRETGVVLGAIHREVMIRGGIPLCVVPLGAAAA